MLETCTVTPCGTVSCRAYQYTTLPTSSATPQKKPDKPTYVSIKADLAVAIGETLVKRVDLVRTLDGTPNMTKDSFIFLRADRAVPYGDLMNLMNELRSGGYLHVALVGLDADTAPPR